MPDCSRWVPFSTNRKVTSWECHWKKHQIAADESSVWKIGSSDYHWKRHHISQWMRDRLAGETTGERDARFECDTARHRNRLSRHCLFFSSVPSKSRCIIPMQTWLHWIYQCYASHVFWPFLVPWQRVMKEGDYWRRARMKIICVQQQVMSLHFSTVCFIFAFYVRHA